MPNESMLFLDMSPLLEGLEDFKDQLIEKMGVAAHALATQADARIKEQAAQKLHSRLDQFLKGIEGPTEISKGVYAITLDASARWIEDGSEPHNMLEDLLASPKAKTAADGSKYLIIPFKHSKGPKSQTPQSKELLSALKKELQTKKIPYKKVERNGDGSPKTGLLHSFDMQNPKQQHRVPMGVEGPSGKKFAANTPSNGNAGPEGRPYLWGTRIYQTPKKNKQGGIEMGDDGHPKVERNIFTFRVASSKQTGSGMWDHPGNSPMHFMDDAFEWAKQEWDTNVAPEILRSLGI